MFVKPEDNEKATFSRNIKVTSKVHNNNLKPQRKSRAQQLKDLGNNAMKLYASLDMFGKPIVLKYQGQEVFKSIYGTTMSLSVLGGMLAFFIVSFLLFIQRKNLSFSFLSESRPIPDPINLWNYTNTLEWILGVDVIDEEKGKSNFDPSYFTYEINYKQNSLSDPTLNKEVDPYFVECKDSESFTSKMNPKDPNSTTYYDFYKMTDKETNLETPGCFRIDRFKLRNNQSEYLNVTLEGNQVSEIHKYISIKLHICTNDNKIEGVECAPPEEIKKKIDASVVRLYFTHQRFNPIGNDSNPIVNNTIFFRFNIQKFFKQKYDIYLQQNKINDFWEILKTLPSAKELFSFSDNYDFSLDFVQESDFGSPKFPLLELTINADKVKNTYVRKFTNIKEFFVDVVGILNGMWAGGTAVGRIINAMLLKRDLINKNFWIMDEEEQKENQQKGIKKTLTKISEGKPMEIASIKKKISIVSEPDINKSNSINKSGRGLLIDRGKSDKGNSNEIDNKNEINIADDSESMISESPSEKKANEVRVAGYISNRWFNSESLMLPIISKKFSRFNMTFVQLIQSMMPCFKDKQLVINKKIFNDCGLIIDSFFDIDTIVSLLREYQNLRNVVLTPEEYKILKMITTPKIEIKGEDIIINKAEKSSNNEENLKSMYLQFAQSVNRLVRSSHLTTAEYNLLELHKISHLGNKNKDKEKEQK